MRTRFRRASLLLLTALLVLSFTACGKTENNNDIPGNPDETEEELNMYGYEFEIMSYNRGNVLQFMPAAGDTAMGDAQLAHYANVEKAINIKINVFDGNAAHVTTITNSAATGTKACDMADMFMGDAMTLYKSGCVTPLNTLMDEDELFSGKYGTRSQLEATSHKRLNGTDYWAFKCAYWGIPYPSFQSAMYYNNVLLQEFGQPNPYEMYEGKKWTWDNFKEVCDALVTQGDDPADESDDTFGLPNDSAQRYVPRAAMTSNGVKYVFFNETTGKYETDLNSPQCIAALEYCRSLVESGAMKVMSGNTSDSLVGNAVYAFMSGRTGFLVEYTYHGLVDKGSLSYSKDFVFEWITFPWGPDGTYGQMNSTISNNDHYVIIPTNVDPYDTGSILPILLEPFEGYDNNGWRESLTQRCFFSTQSAELFFEMYDNAQFDFYDAQGEFFGGDQTNSILAGRKTASEVMNSVIEKIQKSIDDNRNALMLTELE